jgi:hypothetical protein
MTNKKDKGVNRRSVIATAAAAGAALPLLAGTAKAQGMMRQSEGTKFVVDLGGVRLPEADAKALGDKISSACLEALARAHVKFERGPLGPGTEGFVAHEMPAGMMGPGGMQQGH